MYFTESTHHFQKYFFQCKMQHFIMVELKVQVKNFRLKDLAHELAI